LKAWDLRSLRILLSADVDRAGNADGLFVLGESFATVAATLLSALGVATAPLAPSTPAAPAAPAVATAPAIVEVGQLETAVLGELNSVRREHGLVPLKLSVKLGAAADLHSRQMGAGGYFKHESGDGSAFWKRVARFYPSEGAHYWSVGENLLWASPEVDAAGALKLWMNSPEHKKNILTARWREIGISAVKVAAAPGTFAGLDVTIVTTDFGVRR
jgi:uncharacterized protein YkwD